MNARERAEESAWQAFIGMRESEKFEGDEREVFGMVVRWYAEKIGGGKSAPAPRFSGLWARFRGWL